MGQKITQKRLRSLLHYDPETGNFTWLVAHGRFERIPAGTKAGTLSKTASGLVVRLDGQTYLLHRLAWLYVTGRWPKEHIDHIDMDRANNRLSNLREATHAENMQNRGAQRNKTRAPYKGVQWIEHSKKWRAYISVKRKFRHLGMFDTAEEASEAYLQAARKLHGRFARHR